MQGRRKGPKLGLNKNGWPVGVYLNSRSIDIYGNEINYYQWRFMYSGKRYSGYGRTNPEEAMRDREAKIREIVGV